MSQNEVVGFTVLCWFCLDALVVLSVSSAMDNPQHVVFVCCQWEVLKNGDSKKESRKAQSWIALLSPDGTVDSGNGLESHQAS